MKVAIAGIEENVKNYIAAVTAVGLEPVVTTDPAQAMGFAGLLLPGGGDIDPALYGEENQGSRDIDRALDQAQLAMATAFIAAGRPILGICKGHQLLNVYLGGTIIQDLTTAPAHRYQEGDAVHPCLSAPGSLLARLYGSRFAVNSTHHQGLGRLGTGLRVTAWAPDGTVEAMEHETLPLISVQFHPERMGFAKARPDTVDGGAIFETFKALLKA
jgi:putative glutamine amidotransferase